MLFIIAVLYSCQLLKREKLSTKDQSEKLAFQTDLQLHTLSQQNQLLVIDSSRSDFTVWLWPKGSFTFSPAKGFEGEAEKIVVKGKQAHQKIFSIRNELKKDSTAIKANYNRLKQQSTTIEKTKLTFAHSWAWYLLIPIVFLGYLAYKKLN